MLKSWNVEKVEMLKCSSVGSWSWKLKVEIVMCVRKVEMLKVESWNVEKLKVESWNVESWKLTVTLSTKP